MNINRSQYPWQQLLTIGKTCDGRLSVPLDTSEARIKALAINLALNEIVLKYYSGVTESNDEDEVRKELAVEAHRSREVLFALAATCLTDFTRRCKLKLLTGLLNVSTKTGVPRIDNVQINFVFDNEEPCALIFDNTCELFAFKGLRSGYIRTFNNNTEGMRELLKFVDTEYEKHTSEVDLSEV